MLSDALKSRLRPYVPESALRARRRVLRVQRELPLTRLKYYPRPRVSFAERRRLVEQIRAVDDGITCAHTPAEMEEIIGAILAMPPSSAGCIVEAGCFKGGSTAKLSLAARLTGRALYVFDSFAGLPEHDEPHDRTLFGEKIDFSTGRYTGRLDEVRRNVARLGAIDACEFVPGWFDDTMPLFRETIAVAFIDVDLAASTRTCLRCLYPLLAPGGSIFSHDGHLPLCLEVFADDRFWTDEVGYPRPSIPGLGRRKLLRIRKPEARES
jgi:O-methyltransferase